MDYSDFKSKVRRAYPNFKIDFTTNGAQHMAVVDKQLTLYTNFGSDAIYGMMNGVSIGRATGIE